MDVQDRVAQHVREAVVPLIQEVRSNLNVGYVERTQGKQAAKEYTEALAELTALATFTPEIFTGEVQGVRPAGYTLKREAKVATDRLRRFYTTTGTRYHQALDEIAAELDADEIMAAIT